MAGARRFYIFLTLGFMVILLLFYHPTSLPDVSQLRQYGDHFWSSKPKEPINESPPEELNLLPSVPEHSSNEGQPEELNIPPSVPEHSSNEGPPEELNILPTTPEYSGEDEHSHEDTHNPSDGFNILPAESEHSVEEEYPYEDIQSPDESAPSAAPTYTSYTSHASYTSYTSYTSPTSPGPSSFGLEDIADETDDIPAPPETPPNYDQDYSLFDQEKWYFQNDLEDYSNPKFDVHKLAQYPAHNYRGPGHETFATYLSTRNGSLQDPYFLATQQLTYRFLWDPRSKSKKHPLTVFVAPFISQIQRDYLSAAGAIVRELDLYNWQPSRPVTASYRWKDLFSKLNLWDQLDFSRIAYFDTDAFPLANVDPLLDELSTPQKCNPELVPQEDQSVLSEICNYVMTVTMDPGGNLNAGMFIMEPNQAMHTHLMRESQRSDTYDNSWVEQAFLSYAYRPDGPFPRELIERKWNALFTSNEDEGKINVIHEKLWAFWLSPDHFAANYFNETWIDMLKLYEAPEFEEMRAADGGLSHFTSGEPLVDTDSLDLSGIY